MNKSLMIKVLIQLFLLMQVYDCQDDDQVDHVAATTPSIACNKIINFALLSSLFLIFLCSKI